MVNLNDLINKLKNDKFFLFVRYNDGEFIALTMWDYIYKCSADKSPGNCDGHKYTKKLSNCLRYAISCEDNIMLSKEEKYIFQTKLLHYIKMHKEQFNLNDYFIS